MNYPYRGFNGHEDIPLRPWWSKWRCALRLHRLNPTRFVTTDGKYTIQGKYCSRCGRAYAEDSWWNADMSDTGKT